MRTTRTDKLTQGAKRLGVAVEKMPRHIAIIMDGNGRWATGRGLERFEGHKQGGKTVERIVQHSVDLGLECLTLYSFSMQNWKRPQQEIEFLMYLYVEYLKRIGPMLNKNDVKLVHLGRTEKLPKELTEQIAKIMEQTAENKGLILGLALNYGGREEIVDAARKIADKCCKSQMKIDDIDEACIADNLYTAGMPDPDLLIRTSNEMRISNFLLWQISYAEFYVTDTLWPDFSNEELEQAIAAFASRSRRMGDVKPQL